MVRHKSTQTVHPRMSALATRSLSLACALFVVPLLFSQLHAQWTSIQVPTTRILTGIYFADSLNGWVSCADGIFHTTDGGDNWTLQWQGQASQLSGTNARNCWATTSSDTLLHTTDGGQAWVTFPLRSILDSIAGLGRICFVDSLHGWVLGWKRDASGWIFRTTNGGMGWLPIPLPRGYPTTTFCTFSDEQTGWISGDSYEILRTTDGGSTWAVSSTIYFVTTDIQFISRQMGWVCTDAPVAGTEVMRSTDGGYSWQPSHRFECSALTAQVWFVDSAQGWATELTCFGLEIIHTSDGGATWVSQFMYSPTSSYRPTRIYFVDRFHGWVIGRFGLMFRTRTGGVTSTTPEHESVISEFVLSQNYPNPFNPSKTISFTLPTEVDVTIKVYDVLGQEVKNLLRQRLRNGLHKVEWDGEDCYGRPLASGIYFYQLYAIGSANQLFSSTRKTIIIR